MTRRPITAPLLLLALGLLVGGLLWFPAAIALRALPAPLGCTGASGTLWSGGCARLLWQGIDLGALDWRLRPAALLAGRASLELRWTLRDDQLRGDLEATGQRITVSALRGRLTLGSMRALPIWPPAWSAHLARADGRLTLDLLKATWQAGSGLDLRGSIEGEGLAWRGPERWELGGMRVTFSAEPAATGEVIDTGGPLQVRGRLTLAHAPAWAFEGVVSARDPRWAPRLMMLGPPDPLGRHPLSVVGQ